MTEIRVNVSNHQTLFEIDDDQIVAAVKSVLNAQQISAAEVSIAIVDDPQIHALNREHLSHDYPTDVLSFLYEATDTTIDGELIVSTDTARRVGAEHGMQEHDELVLYVVHGTLHLVGFDDDTDAAQSEMREQERRHMKSLGVVVPDETLPDENAPAIPQRQETDSEAQP